jgi:transcriptional regulator with XRE-family HTH domain
MADSPQHPLRAARMRERFTLRELGDVCGLNFRRLHAIENGAQPSQIEARLICAALRIPLSDLLDAQTVPR